MPTRADHALLLRRIPFGESSLVVHVLTRARGRVHLLAKGAHRVTSRFFGVLDLFDTLGLEWSHAHERDLLLLKRGEVLRRRRAIATDLEAFGAATGVLELCDLAARPGQNEEGLFDLALRALDDLEAGDLPADLVIIAFELGYLGHLGLAPALERCAACDGEAAAVTRGRAAFSAGAGGRLCRTCAEEARQSGKRVGTLPLAVLEAARGVVAWRAGEAAGEPPQGRDAADTRLRERVRDFVGRFLDYHLETQPKSHQTFLAAPNRNAPGARVPAHI